MKKVIIEILPRAARRKALEIINEGDGSTDSYEVLEYLAEIAHERGIEVMAVRKDVNFPDGEAVYDLDALRGAVKARFEVRDCREDEAAG
jgi:hypothetical protein